MEFKTERYVISFTANDTDWRICLVSGKELLDNYNNTHEIHLSLACGCCDYGSQTIYLNEDIEYTGIISALKHELTHCWMYVNGFYCKQYDEEDICNIVSASHNFVAGVCSSFVWKAKGANLNICKKCEYLHKSKDSRYMCSKSGIVIINQPKRICCSTYTDKTNKDNKL